MKKRTWAALAAHAALAAACSPGTTGTPDPDTGPSPGTPPGGPPSAAAREHEIRGSRRHDVAIAGALDATGMDAGRLVAATQADLRGRIGAIPPGEFAELHRELSTLRGGARLETVVMRQTVGGVPIDDTYLYMAVRHDARGARLVSSSYRLFENVALDARPALSRDRAIALAQTGLRLRRPVAPRSAELVVRRLAGRLQLAWRVSFPGTYPRAFVVASGGELGRIHVIDPRIYETTGSVAGPVVHGGAPGGLGVAEVSPLPDVQVAGGALQVSADAAGRYAITVPNGTLLTATLAGRAAIVTDLAGAPLSATAPALAGGVTDLAMTTTAETGLAQSTAYAIVDQVRSFLEANGMDPARFGPPLPTNTNLNDTCNAFYDIDGRSINFFRSGGGCNNSAIDTVIAHEYGHFIDDIHGGILDGGLSEGWGDLLACLWSKQPVLAFDLFPGQPLRSCQNDYVYPPGGFDEPHSLGQAWQGFGWDVRQNLIAELGPSGDDLARSLLLPSFQSNAPDIPSAVLEVFLRDDDDGDLANHTPHWDPLIAAAAHHGVAFAAELDGTPPAPVTDLAITATELTQLDVTWTAPGDDGTTGTAAAYELRWAQFPITAENFGAALQVATAAPQPAGSHETASIVVPPGTTVFVALIAVDERGNASSLSNVATATTPGGTQVFAESAEADTGAWTATGLWHVTTRRASDGSHAFWYGKEDTGNYNTGGANSGDLTSPVIDLSGIASPLLVFDQFIDVESNPFDLTQVTVSDVNDPGHTLLIDKDTASSAGAFASRLIALTGFAGKQITLRFHFDTLDGAANSSEGWYVDHLRVIGTAQASCPHELCTMGDPLPPSCSSCAASVCAFDSFCCTSAWDAQCVQEARSTCGLTCATCGNGSCEDGETPASCPQDCRPPCAHEVCEPGVALDAVCDTCASNVCALDPFCCSVFWDRVCVEESETVCGQTCQGCAHEFCAVGDALASTCDACATSVCSSDPYCCTTAWDSRCVQEAADGCGLSCTVCSHSLCSQGTALETTCDPCVTAVCGADPYCCDHAWDQRCIDKAEATCGTVCATDRAADSLRAHRADAGRSDRADAGRSDSANAGRSDSANAGRSDSADAHNQTR